MATLPALGDDLTARPILEETVRVVRAHPLQLLGPMVLLGILSGAGNGPRYQYNSTPPTNPMEYLPFFAIFGLVALVVIIVIILAYSLAALITTRAALDALETGREPDLNAAYRGVVGGYWGAFGTFILWTLAIAVGFILLIVPGFIVLAGLFPLAAVVVAEGTHSTVALRRAWELTMGHKWHIFLVGLVLGLISIVGSALLSWLPLIGGILGGIVSGAMTGATLVAAAIYYKRRTRSAAIVMPPLDAPPAAAPPAW